jgi:hypothetical protein
MTKHTGAPAKPEQRGAKPKTIRGEAPSAERNGKVHDKASPTGKPVKGKPQAAKPMAHTPAGKLAAKPAGRKAPRVTKGK